MSEISAEERRKRRQEKIKAGSANRLAKITEGNRGRAVDTSSSSNSINSSTASSSSTSSIPISTSNPPSSSSLPHNSVPKSNISSHSHISEKENYSELNVPGISSNSNSQAPQNPLDLLNLNDMNISNEQQQQQIPSSSENFDDDPLFKLLSQLNSVGGNSPGGGPADFNAFASQLASVMGGATGAAGGGGDSSSSPNKTPGATPSGASSPRTQQSYTNQTTTTHSSRRADIFWSLIHFLIFLSLAIISGFTFSQLRKTTTISVNEKIDEGSSTILESADQVPETYSPSKLLWYFSTLELVLQTTRFFLENGAPPADSKITKLAVYLPHPFSGYLYTGARYIRMVRTIVQDFCLLLFVSGLYSLVSNTQ